MASGIVRLGRPKTVHSVLAITESAGKRLSEMLKARSEPCIGFRLGVKQRGCTGESYELNYTDHANKYDEVVKHKDVTIVIDSKALLTVLGSEMDYVHNKLESGFVFTNPNAKGVCGCGESFTTQ